MRPEQLKHIAVRRAGISGRRKAKLDLVIVVQKILFGNDVPRQVTGKQQHLKLFIVTGRFGIHCHKAMFRRRGTPVGDDLTNLKLQEGPCFGRLRGSASVKYALEEFVW